MQHPIFQLLKKLDQGNFSYTLSRHRDDAIMVKIVFVGERLEVEVFEDGHMEVARFLGTEDILGDAELVFDIIKKNMFENKMYENYTEKE